MSSKDFLVEKLLEQRDLNLNNLKHLDFEMLMDPSDDEIEKIKNIQENTINELKKIEQEIAFLTSKKP